MHLCIIYNYIVIKMVWYKKNCQNITFTIGPCVGIPANGESASRSTERRGLNAAMLCVTPSANINFSRNSMFVRPLAIHGRAIFFFDCLIHGVAFNNKGSRRVVKCFKGLLGKRDLNREGIFWWYYWWYSKSMVWLH